MGLKLLVPVLSSPLVFALSGMDLPDLIPVGIIGEAAALDQGISVHSTNGLDTKHEHLARQLFFSDVHFCFSVDSLNHFGRMFP